MNWVETDHLQNIRRRSMSHGSTRSSFSSVWAKPPRQMTATNDSDTDDRKAFEQQHSNAKSNRWSLMGEPSSAPLNQYSTDNPEFTGNERFNWLPYVSPLTRLSTARSEEPWRQTLHLSRSEKQTDFWPLLQQSQQWPGSVVWLGTHQLRHAIRRSACTATGALGENDLFPRANGPRAPLANRFVHLRQFTFVGKALFASRRQLSWSGRAMHKRATQAVSSNREGRPTFMGSWQKSPPPKAGISIISRRYSEPRMKWTHPRRCVDSEMCWWSTAKNAGAIRPHQHNGAARVSNRTSTSFL